MINQNIPNLDRFFMRETNEQKFCQNILNSFQKIDDDTRNSIEFKAKFDSMIYAKNVEWQALATVFSHDTSISPIKTEINKYFDNVFSLFKENNNLKDGYTFFESK